MWMFFFSFLLTSLMASMTSGDGSSPFLQQVRIFENVKIGTPVAQISDLFHLPATATNFKLLKQKLLRQNRNKLNKRTHRKWLDVDKNTGLVTLRHRVDREEMCGDIDPCIIHLEMFAVDLRRLLNLDVIIDDVNDNSPRFSVSQIELNISENAQVDDVIMLNEYIARDDDLGLNGKISYSISSNPYFVLEERTDHTDTTQLQLRVIKKLEAELQCYVQINVNSTALVDSPTASSIFTAPVVLGSKLGSCIPFFHIPDYESSPVQMLTLTATDNGIPPLTGQTDLVVRISNVNDNDPIFEKQVYSVTWPENLNSGKLIAQVRASDADSEDSGTLRYSISRRNNDIALQLLRVNPETGDVILKQTLDREIHDKLRVLLEARDADTVNQRVGRTWLELQVEDINDNFPQIDVNFILPHEKDTVYLAENSTIGTYIAYITAKDADSGQNGKVNVSIHSIASDRKNSVVGLKNTFILTRDGFLSLNTVVDREILDSYYVNLQACDQGTQPKCSTKAVKVQLLDINDHRPTFSTSIINLRLPEDTKIGKVLTKVVARDDDIINRPIAYENDQKKIVTSPLNQTPFGDVMYHVIDGDGTFNVEPQTGEVILTKPLDRESSDNMQVTLRAKDSSGRGALQSTCKLHVIITDVNDNKPKFVNPQRDNLTYYATILRNDVILRVQAIDNDLLENGTVSYRISTEDGPERSRDNTTSLFVVNRKTGELKLNPTNNQLNQSLGTHKIVVEAYDGGTPPFISSRNIDVVICDSAVLPKSPESSWFVTSPKALAVLLTCAVTSFIILLVLIVVICIRCRSKARKNRSQLPRIVISEPCHTNAATKSSQPENNNVVSTENIKQAEVDEVHHNRQEFTLISHHPSASSSTQQGGQPDDGESTQQLPPCDITTLVRHDRCVTMSMTSHDADSGRGDSDPDVPASDVTQDYVCQSPTGRHEEVSIHPASQCTEQCLVDGHSDACWMPKDGRNLNICSLSPSSGRGNYLKPPLYVELRPLSPPTRFDDQVNHLEKIPESRLMRWNYPANELSSIYSDIIVSQQNQNFCPPYRILAQKKHLEEKTISRLSPASSVSSSSHKPSYEEFIQRRRHPYLNKNFRRPHPPLVKSASADQLLNAQSSLSAGPPRPPSADPNTISSKQFSMKETTDIVDDVEKLLIT